MEVDAGAGAGAGGGRKSFGGATKQQTRKRRRGLSKGPSGSSSGPGTADHVDKERVAKYMRGSRNTHRKVKDKKLKGSIKRSEREITAAAEAAARAELLLPEDAGYLEADGELERTYKFKQTDIAEAVHEQVARKKLDITLDKLGPYRCRFDRGGQHMLLGGHKGHLAMMDWNRFQLQSEFHVRETTRDIAILHNYTLYATAQKKYVYIYDKDGVELHVLRNHIQPNVLDFLPYHFLLVSVGQAGYLKYQDTSTGQLVAEHRTKLGDCRVMRQNPFNACMCLGHGNGTVTMWTPNMNQPVVKMLAHRGPVTALSVDASGRYMATAGADTRVKVWDIRTFKPLQDYFSIKPVTTMDISQRDMLALGFGSHVRVWKDCFAEKAKSPYMSHELPGRQVHDIRFRPYDDVLAIGHDHGISSMIVPGAGEPNYDTNEANPYQTKKQRRENEVHQLLDKLPSSMIMLDPTEVGQVDRAPLEVKEKEKAARAAAIEAHKIIKIKKKTRGRSRTSRRAAKKQANVVTQQKAAMRDKVRKQQREEKRLEAERKSGEGTAGVKSALSRFYERRRT